MASGQIKAEVSLAEQYQSTSPRRVKAWVEELAPMIWEAYLNSPRHRDYLRQNDSHLIRARHELNQKFVISMLEKRGDGSVLLERIQQMLQLLPEQEVHEDERGDSLKREAFKRQLFLCFSLLSEKDFSLIRAIFDFDIMIIAERIKSDLRRIYREASQDELIYIYLEGDQETQMTVHLPLTIKRRELLSEEGFVHPLLQDVIRREYDISFDNCSGEWSDFSTAEGEKVKGLSLTLIFNLE